MAIQHIAVASDFSRYADFALERAIHLAEQHQAALHFIHVLDQPLLGNISYFSIHEQQQESFPEKKQAEDELLSLLKKQAHHLKTNVSVVAGRAADEIVRSAEENACDLIVAGAHGRYYVNDYVLGTVSSAIIQQSQTPVLLVKKEPKFSYERILLATDFSEASQYAIEFAFHSFPKAKFQVLHVVDMYYQKKLNRYNESEQGRKQSKKKDIIEKLDDFLQQCNVVTSRFEKKIIGGYFADSIITQAEQWQADLIAFGTQGNSKLHYVLIGSVAKRILQMSQRDMLSVPLKKP